MGEEQEDLTPTIKETKTEHPIMSQEVKELATALSKAQGEMVPAKKSAENPFFKSKYADLASVWDVCREPLSKNGLSIIQATAIADGKTLLRTILLHSSGQWVESQYPVNPVKTDPQGVGSAITYARRYTLMAMVGIAPEEDDVEGAVDRSPAKAKPIPKASDAQIGKIHAMLKESGIDDATYRKQLKGTFKVTSSKQLNVEQASKLIDMLGKQSAKVKPKPSDFVGDEDDLFPEDQQFANAGEFLSACASPPLNRTRSVVLEALSIKDINEIKDFTKAYQKLLDIFEVAPAGQQGKE